MGPHERPAPVWIELTDEPLNRKMVNEPDGKPVEKPGREKGSTLMFQQPHACELLNESLFFGLDHARSAFDEWAEDYTRIISAADVIDALTVDRPVSRSHAPSDSLRHP